MRGKEAEFPHPAGLRIRLHYRFVSDGAGQTLGFHAICIVMQ